MKKINLYVFIQLFKSCTLIFFIFTSIGWLLQVSRLVSYLNKFQVKLLDILYLSLFLIPNLVNVVIPFVAIFGILIALIKLDRDKEIIAIFSLGLNLKTIKFPIIYLSIFFSILYVFLNFFFSPFVYEHYKYKEFELRNAIDIKNINVSNFIELENKFILDFDKKNKIYENIYINFKEDEDTKENVDNIENIIFAKKGNIVSEINNFNFTLINGYKLSLYKDKIEKLEFKKYNIKFPKKSKLIYNNYDKNTKTILDLIKNKNFKILNERFFDIIILLSIIVFLYFKIIKLNNFKIENLIQVLCVSVGVLLIQNLIKNIEISYIYFFITNILNIMLLYIFTIFTYYKNK